MKLYIKNFNLNLAISYLYILPVLSYFYKALNSILGKYILYGKLLNQNEFFIKVKKNKIIKIMTFMRYHTNCMYHTLVDIAAVDMPKKKKRFELNYFLLNYQKARIVIKFDFFDKEWIDSVVSVYKGANWLERENWDMFGIFFDRHPDLRRILTDYGFTHFPLRKEYPVVGYLEIRYDDILKQLVYEKVTLPQMYRVFDFQTPWIGMKF